MLTKGIGSFSSFELSCVVRFMPSIMREGIWKVLQKFRKSEMSSVEFTATTKSALRALIEREAVKSGSRTVAYEVVAKTIGASSSWIRKFLTYEDRVAEPRITLFRNIATYYNNVCERIEAENREDEHRLRQLRGKIDAISQGIVRESKD